jgi:ubiquinone/menaquinone biosynthesis C-methylase UbiE
MKQSRCQGNENWYQKYYSVKGENRNDIIGNSGVFFQTIASQKSIVESFREIPFFEKNKWRVLDVGCGSGVSLLQLLGLGFEPSFLYGIDILPERILEAENKLSNINFSVGDAAMMEYASNYFDLVMESTMFIQLTDESLSGQIADEMLRVVKPEGYIMLTDWRYSWRHPEYCKLSSRRIAQLFHVGKKTSQVSYHYGALIPPIGRFLSSYLPSLYFGVSKICPFLVGQVTVVLQKMAED